MDISGGGKNTPGTNWWAYSLSDIHQNQNTASYEPDDLWHSWLTRQSTMIRVEEVNDRKVSQPESKLACMTLTWFWGPLTSTRSRAGLSWRRGHFWETQTYLKRYILSSPRFSLPALPADQWQSSSHAAGSRNAPYTGSFSALPSPSAEKVITKYRQGVIGGSCDCAPK